MPKPETDRSNATSAEVEMRDLASLKNMILEDNQLAEKTDLVKSQIFKTIAEMDNGLTQAYQSLSLDLSEFIAHMKAGSDEYQMEGLDLDNPWETVQKTMAKIDEPEVLDTATRQKTDSLNKKFKEFIVNNNPEKNRSDSGTDSVIFVILIQWQQNLKQLYAAIEVVSERLGAESDLENIEAKANDAFNLAARQTLIPYNNELTHYASLVGNNQVLNSLITEQKERVTDLTALVDDWESLTLSLNDSRVKSFVDSNSQLQSAADRAKTYEESEACFKRLVTLRDNWKLRRKSLENRIDELQSLFQKKSFSADEQQTLDKLNQYKEKFDSLDYLIANMRIQLLALANEKFAIFKDRKEKLISTISQLIKKEPLPAAEQTELDLAIAEMEKNKEQAKNLLETYNTLIQVTDDSETKSQIQKTMHELQPKKPRFTEVLTEIAISEKKFQAEIQALISAYEQKKKQLKLTDGQRDKFNMLMEPIYQLAKSSLLNGLPSGSAGILDFLYRLITEERDEFNQKYYLLAQCTDNYEEYMKFQAEIKKNNENAKILESFIVERREPAPAFIKRIMAFFTSKSTESFSTELKTLFSPSIEITGDFTKYYSTPMQRNMRYKSLLKALDEAVDEDFAGGRINRETYEQSKTKIKVIIDGLEQKIVAINNYNVKNEFLGMQKEISVLLSEEESAELLKKIERLPILGADGVAPKENSLTRAALSIEMNECLLKISDSLISASQQLTLDIDSLLSEQQASETSIVTEIMALETKIRTIKSKAAIYTSFLETYQPFSSSENETLDQLRQRLKKSQDSVAELSDASAKQLATLSLIPDYGLSQQEHLISKQERLGEKKGGKNSPGLLGGEYELRQSHKKVLFKQDTKGKKIHHFKNIAEGVSSHLLQEFIPGSAAKIFYARTNDAEGPDPTGESIYIGSLFFENYQDLFKDISKAVGRTPSEERPRMLGSLNKEPFRSVITSNRYSRQDLARVLISSLLIGDFDMHVGNIGVVTDPTTKVKNLVRIDFGGAMKRLSDEVHPHSRLLHLPGLGPTNHFREFPRELRVCRETADECARIAEYDAKKIERAIDAAIDDAANYYGAVPLMQFAKRIGYPVKTLPGYPDALTQSVVVDQLKQYLKQKLAARQKSLGQYALEINIDLAIDKDSQGQYKLKNYIDVLITENPEYFKQANFHFRAKDHKGDWVERYLTGAKHRKLTALLKTRADQVLACLDIKNIWIRKALLDQTLNSNVEIQQKDINFFNNFDPSLSVAQLKSAQAKYGIISQEIFDDELLMTNILGEQKRLKDIGVFSNPIIRRMLEENPELKVRNEDGIMSRDVAQAISQINNQEYQDGKTLQRLLNKVIEGDVDLRKNAIADLANKLGLSSQLLEEEMPLSSFFELIEREDENQSAQRTIDSYQEAPSISVSSTVAPLIAIRITGGTSPYEHEYEAASPAVQQNASVLNSIELKLDVKKIHANEATYTSKDFSTQSLVQRRQCAHWNEDKSWVWARLNYVIANQVDEGKNEVHLYVDGVDTVLINKIRSEYAVDLKRVWGEKYPQIKIIMHLPASKADYTAVLTGSLKKARRFVTAKAEIKSEKIKLLETALSEVKKPTFTPSHE